MDLKQETRQFGELSVTVVEFDAWNAFDMLPRLGMVAGSLLEAAGGDMAAALRIVPEICKAIAQDKELLLDLLKSASVTKNGTIFSINSKERFNAAFSGNLWTVIEALRLVLEVSFTDFLSQMMNALGDLDLGQEKEGDAPST